MSANTNLGNTPVSQGFSQLYHTGETGGLTTTLQQVFDGDGTGSDLHLATNKVKIATPANFLLGSDSITEFIQDVVGSMLTTGSYTNVTTTYDDSNGNIDISASGEVTLTGSQTLTNKTFTSPVINTGVSGTAILDEDTMSSNSDSKLATQQSIKAYVDAEVAGIVNSAPSALDTLDELASALGDDANFATTTATSLGEKLVKSSNLSDLTNTATARSNLGVDASGTDNSTNVTLAGSRDYITISGQQITRNQIDISDDTNLVGGTGITLTGDTLSTTDSEIVHDNLSGFVANEHINHSSVTLTAGAGLDGGGDITANRSFALNINDLDAQSPALELADKVAIYDNSASENNVATLTQLKAIVNTDTNTMGSGFVLEDGDGTEVTITENKELKFIDGNGLNIDFTDTDNGSDADPFDLTFSVDISPLSLDSSPDEQDLLIIEDATDGSIKKTKVGLVGGGGTITSVSNMSNNRILTASGSTTINGEANFTIDGTSLQLGDSKILSLGNSDDLQIHHTSNQNRIDLNNGNLTFRDDGDNNIFIIYREGGGIQLSEGDLKIPATSKLYLDGGSHTYISEDIDDRLRIFVGGQEMIRLTEDSTDYVMIPDNVRLSVGTGNDFQAFHNETNTFLKNNTGDFYISNDANDKDLILRSDDGSGGQTAYITLDGSTTDLLLSPPGEVEINGGAGTDLDPLLRVQKKVDGNGSATGILLGAVAGGQSKAGIFFENLGVGNGRGSLYFCNENTSDTSDATIADAKMTITRDGDIGMGTTSPSAKLDVAGNIEINNSSDPTLTFQEGSLTKAQIVADNEGSAGGSLEFFTRVDGGSSTEKMRITSGGNVGIGETGPTHKLQVASAGSSDSVIRINADDNRGANRYALDIVDDDTNSRGSVRVSTASGTALYIDGGVGGANIAEFHRTSGATASVKIHAGGGDPQITYADTDRTFSMGIDASENHFKIAEHTDLGSNERFRIADSGNIIMFNNVGIGETSIDANLHITGSPVVLKMERAGHRAMRMGTPDNSSLFIFADSDDLKSNIAIEIDSSRDVKITESVGIGVAANGTAGRLDCSNDVVAFASSDKRLKENIKPLDNALDKINKINGVEFDWKKLTEKEKETIHGNTGHDVGVIAQEIEEVLPEVVQTRDNGYKAVKYEKIVPLLIEAIKELKQEIEELK